MLSFSSGATACSSACFGQGSGPILLDDVTCRGSESTLLSCSHRGIGSHNCVHSEDAGVRCLGVLCYGSVVKMGERDPYGIDIYSQVVFEPMTYDTLGFNSTS